VHARPLRPPAGASPYLGPHPLTPLADRERGRWRGARRVAILAAVAIALAVATPMLGAAVAPAAPPLAGDVARAVSEPSATPTPTSSSTPSSPPSSPAGDPRLAVVRATDPDAPMTISQRIPPPVASLTGYRWPISKGRVTLPFKAIPGGEWINDGKLFHDGVDMASFCGAPVGAAHDGVVLAAGRNFDNFIGWVGDLRPYYHRLDVRHTWGDLPNVVVIDDGNGYRSIYAHFRDVTVRPGERVRAGQLIGHEGRTGHASGCHVHYGLFSPLEKRTFGVRPDIVRHMLLPRFELARIDPLLVLPGGDVALRTRNIAKAIAAARVRPA
jgi:murein DD-endopeptidase MepM/ murein hydrolase activator NlpD